MSASHLRAGRLMTIQPPPCRPHLPSLSQLLTSREPPDSAGLLFGSFLFLQEPKWVAAQPCHSTSPWFSAEDPQDILRTERLSPMSPRPLWLQSSQRDLRFAL